MQFVNDPRKAKIAFVLTLIFAIFFFLASGALGYFYWQKAAAYKNLNAEKQKLQDELKSFDEMLTARTTELQNQITILENENTALDNEKKNLEKQVVDYKTKQAKIAAYKEFFKYLNQVVETHSGYSGWTDAEFQTGKSKAEATGDADFVSLVNWAWYETSVDPFTRVITVYKAIVTGIERGL